MINVFEIVGGLGIVGAMLALYKINNDKIEKTREDFHKVDKNLAILTTILEIKWGKAIVEKARKQNGDNPA